MWVLCLCYWNLRYFNYKHAYFHWYSVAVFLSWARQHTVAADPNSNIRLAYIPHGLVFYYPSLNISYTLHYIFCSSCKNPTVLGCIAGSALMRKAASLAFSNKKRSTVTGDIIECLGKR